jgi:hypothetical protein
MSDWIQLRKARTLIKGCVGPQGDTGPQGLTLYQGNVAIVDSVYGDDSTGSMSGTPYKTIVQALSQIVSGQTIYILPGTYTISSELILKDGISIHGMSVQTTILEMNTDVSDTMITMGENCRIEGLTIKLNCTGTNDNIILKGIVFNGNSSQTSKLRTMVITLDNRSMTNDLSSTVIGVEFAGEGYLTTSSFSFNSIKGSTINVYSNGQGTKRGILVSGTNQVSTRDTNIFVAKPTDFSSTGSYVGVETNDIDQGGSIQLRTTTIGVNFPSSTDGYTASDILQTTPYTITDPTYLASTGIQIGPGTDLVTKSAGEKGFSTYIYPTVIYYGLKGDVNEKKSGYLWPGTQKASGDFPDTNTTSPAYFRIQQPSIISGLSCALNSSPGTDNSVILTVQVTPFNISRVDTSFSVVLSDNELEGTYYNSSYRCGTGDFIHIYIDFSGNKTAAHDVTAQIDLF